MSRGKAEGGMHKGIEFSGWAVYTKGRELEGNWFVGIDWEYDSLGWWSHRFILNSVEKSCGLGQFQTIWALFAAVYIEVIALKKLTKKI